MVEGRTLLVLLLLGRCQHSATVPAARQEGRGFCKARGPQSAHAATLVQQSRAGLCSAMGAGSSLRPAFFFGPLNFVCSARCDHDRMRGCLPLRCLPLSLQLPGARGDWVPQLGFQELVWRLRFLAVDFKLGSRKLTSQTPKLKLKM